MNSFELCIRKCQNNWLRLTGQSTFLLILSLAIPANGEEKPTYLNTQVVTATGSGVSIDDSVIKTEVITSDQLEFMQAKVLTDALRHAPGLKIQRTVKNGSKLNVNGADANHVLILKDGLPFISPTGSETDISQIPLLGIDRIEIIKGAGSALYGSAAMGGVINLVSKEIEGNSAEIDLSRGWYKDYADGQRDEASLFAAGLYGDSKYSGQIYVKDAPEIDLNPDNKSADGASQELKSGELRFDHNLGASNMFLRTSYLKDYKKKTQNDDVQPDPFAGRLYYPAYYESSTTKKSVDGGFRGMQSFLFDDASVLFRYEDYVERSGNRTSQVGKTKQRNADRSLAKIESRFSSYLAESDQQLSYGLSYQNEKMHQIKLDEGGDKNPEVDDKNIHNIEAYIQNDILLTPGNQFIFGLRSQYDSDFDFHHSLKANWMTTQDGWKYRLSYGKGYRIPNLKERFYLFDHSNLGYVIIGNTDLQPETSDNLNATVSVLFDRSTVDFNIFHNEFEDKIETQNTGVKDNIRQIVYRNVERAYTRGIDLTHTLQLETLYWQNSISLLDTKNKTDGTRLENRPRFTFKTQVNAQLTRKLSVSLFGQLERNRFNGLYDSDDTDKEPDSYVTSVTNAVQSWDVKFIYQILPEFSVYGAVENLTNEIKSITFNQATENDERSIDPRLYRVGFKAKF